VAQRPRIIVVDGPDHAAEAELARTMPGRDLVHQPDLAGAIEQSRDAGVEGVFLATASADCRAQADRLVRAEHVLDTLSDGVAILDPALTVVWANPAFRRLAGEDAVGRPITELLRGPDAATADDGLYAAARAGGVGTTRLTCDGGKCLELSLSLAPGTTADAPRYVAQLHDVTHEERRQRKLDALHHAGLALNDLDPDQLADMSVADRVELLKQNLRRFIHDLLQYDVIEIRLLNRQTSELEPLLSEGMMPDAAGRRLYARTEGNGVTGYVAATGKSYLCPDATCDPHYIAGAPGARSSLTVPLMVGDEVIGTFNVESPRPNAFSTRDLQFTETFSRVIAQALHTLELLSAQKRSAATASVDAVSREVALPVDDILAAATALLARAEGHEPEAAEKLKQILAGARSIKQSIQRVGETLVPEANAAADGTAAARLKGLRVLVVDNDDRIRRSAHALLGRFGCQVETARTGQEALAMARVGSYDAILVDIRLPDMGGYDAFRQLRTAQPQARMVLMTAFGYDAGHAIVRARQEGLRFVLYKPFRPDQLVDALVSSPGSAQGTGPQPQILRT
jgi:CheY-like chemotaxis protein/PAS domain-containing protein